MWLCWLLFINLLALFMMSADKRKAQKNARRIPEKALFAAAVAGGTPGAIAGMLLFRHKTRHLRFVIGLPVILLLQLTALLWLN